MSQLPTLSSSLSLSSSFLSFSYLQYVHQLSSNESGLIRWAVHSDLISVILSKLSVNQNVTSSSSNFFKVQIIKWTVNHSDLIFGILVIVISVNQNVTRSSSNNLFLGTMCDCLENWRCTESSEKQRGDRSEWTIMFNLL